MKNVKIGFKEFLIIIILVVSFGLIFFVQDIAGFFNSSITQIEESRKASKEMSDLLIELDKINFDTTILDSSYFYTLNNIPNYPIDTNDSSYGKANPFAGGFTVISSTPDTQTVGGIVTSTQRSDGQSNVRTVNVRQNTRR